MIQVICFRRCLGLVQDTEEEALACLLGLVENTFGFLTRNILIKIFEITMYYNNKPAPK